MKKKKTKDMYITAKMASLYSGINYATILKHIKNGVLETHSISGHHRICLSDFMEYCMDCYRSNRYVMYAPDYIEKRIKDLYFNG